MAVRLIVIAAACLCTSAQASPRSDPTLGRAVFTGAATPHITSIDLDPAALGFGNIDEIYVAVTSVIDRYAIDLDALDVNTGTFSTGPHVKDTEASPGATVAFTYHLPGDRGTLGFAAHTPPGEGFPEGQTALQYHTSGGGERDWIATVAASIKVSNELSIGAALSHQNTFLLQKFSRDTALENGHGPNGIDSNCNGAPCGVANPAATELWDIDVRSPLLSTSNLKVTIGVVYEFMKDWWIGVAYHTPPGFGIQTDLAGYANIDRAPRDGGEHVRGDSVVSISFPASVDAELRAKLPGHLELHVGGRWEDLSRMQGYDTRVYGSVTVQNGIPEWTIRPRGLHDTFSGWAGIEQLDVGDAGWRVQFGGRLGFETSSVDNARTSPLTIAPLSGTLDLGMQARITRASRWTVQLSYGLQYFPTVDAHHDEFDPRYRIECIESGFDYSTRGCEAVRNGYALPSAAGTYSRIEQALRLGLRYEIP